jgi:hypothetical protein
VLPQNETGGWIALGRSLERIKTAIELDRDRGELERDAMRNPRSQKYEILSQTGIAALAQANSVQQEVTKLLQ